MGNDRHNVNRKHGYTRYFLHLGSGTMGNSFSSESATSSQNPPDNDDAKQKYIDEILQKADESDGEDFVDQGDELSSINVRDYVDQFPFENIVFEGGGAKGVVYPGALLALEELGLMAKIKRFAGTSVGSMTACMAALGYSSQEIRKVMETDFRTYFDARLGRLSLLPNLLRHFGWQPMNTLYEFLGELVEKKLGNKDATFSDLYKKTGKELCIVVTNVNNMEEEYFHPKTTPDVPIRMAVRMSASLPGLMQPVHYTTSGTDNIYVDGGLLANYPIACFDGWWLSMKKEDSFLKKMQPLEKLPEIMDRRNRFARNEETADKTLGFVLYANDEMQSFKPVFESRRRAFVVHPDTEMGRKAEKKMKNEMKLRKEYLLVKIAINKFLELASKYDANGDELISKEELSGILSDKNFTKHDRDRLFGKDVTVDDVMTRLDADGNGMIRFQELVAFFEEMGFSMAHRNLGFKRQEVTTLLSLLQTLYTTLSFNIVQIGFSSLDLPRTIGLNSHYVGTLVFDYEKEDVDFLNRESYQSTMAFLKLYAANLKAKGERQ
ncbi:uncharacterized protein LOC125681139 isoform X2 [Ostrea edulis]|uniref:uncharacterized protein LOC125681139 isoform X2 n=1 Tax=Ostrea edulis TaxID=37623 RepID=UPI0020954103|nr:uncharacterized protein LOC125681139 isoform X2 [Ostrea edulis]